MSKSRLVAASAAVAIMLTSCAPRRPAPVPTPPPARQPAPRPSPPPPLAWQDSALTAGDWTYRDEGASSSARYGASGSAVFAMRCESNREVSFVRAGAAGSALIVRTSFGERRLPAIRRDGVMARVPASDPLLDQIAFSRGRFAVEAEGALLLILPAWPEPARIVEDCRG